MFIFNKNTENLNILLRQLPWFLNCFLSQKKQTKKTPALKREQLLLIKNFFYLRLR